MSRKYERYEQKKWITKQMTDMSRKTNDRYEQKIRITKQMTDMSRK